MERSPRSRRALPVLAGLVLVLAVAAGCSSSKKTSGKATGSTSASTSTTAATPTGIVVQAGTNDPDAKAIAITQFMPKTIHVNVGTEVNWTWKGAIEPHSVTFAAGAKAPAPGPPDEKLFTPTPPTGPYDGSTLVNSGLVPLGPGPTPSFKLTFSQPGTYQYFCVIHPLMRGTVEVSAAGGAADTPTQVTQAGQADLAKYKAEGEAALKTFEATPPAKATNADGSTTWTFQMGTTTLNTDILAFSPATQDIKAGDHVRFLNNSQAPHTATFYGNTPPITNPLDPRTAKAIPGASPLTLNLTDLFNSGELPPNAPPGAGPPEAARTFEYIVPKAGAYQFVCILHADSGMAGAITAK
jgi:plastocyanin